MRKRDIYQSSFRFDKRSILSVHFIVKTTGITEIMAISISPPQWSGSGPAVDTLSTLCKEKSNEEMFTKNDDKNDVCRERKVKKSFPESFEMQAESENK